MRPTHTDTARAHSRLPSRGRGPFREEWYSICSAPPGHDPDCPRCRKGAWVNVWRHWAGHQVYRYCYPLWHWWVNRPNSAARRRLERLFPGLKGGRGEKP